MTRRFLITIVSALLAAPSFAEQGSVGRAFTARQDRPAPPKGAPYTAKVRPDGAVRYPD
jgi:hypothetical protein